jgi:hypothetical protein
MGKIRTTLKVSAGFSSASFALSAISALKDFATEPPGSI